MSLSPSEISDTDTLNSTGLGTALPKVGQTRCYWSILTARLDFIYVDPVLSSHLGDQSTELVGRNILDFVHPDERANARNDLSNIIQERGLHGSVTRVRFCRLSTVKEKLGFDGPLPASTLLEQEFPDARKIVYDAHYMTCELVLNWAADHPDIAKFGGGVVLCFLHAAVDIDRVGDNDELRKTTWTNWCGTPLFENEHVNMLYGRLGTDALLSRPHEGGFYPSRIFQIFSSTPERAVLFSWPLTTNSSDYSRLAEGIKIEPSVGARTGCQRRFQSQARVNEKSVESIFIPHGCIIFACHTINGGHSRPVPSPIETARSASPYYPQQPTENGTHSQGFYDSGYVYGSSMTSSRYQNQNANSGSSSFAPLPPMATSEGDWPVSPSFSAPSPMGYHTQPSPIVEQGWSKRTPSPPDSAYPHPHPNAPSWDLPATSTNESNTNNARVRVMNRSHAGRSDQGHRVGPSVSTSTSTPSMVRTATAPASASAPLSGRASGNPPAGVIRCASCNTSQSPEWRKGPSGKKELCNACGLRFARSRAKKEGHQPQKRRKDEKPTQGQGQDGDGEEDPPTPPSGGSLSLSNTTAAAGVGGGERERRRTETPSPPFGRYSTGQGQGQPRIDEEQGFSQFHGHGYSGHGHGYPHTQTSLYSSITGTGPASSNSSYTTLPRINSLDHTHTVTHAQDIYPPPSQSTLPPFGSRPAYDGGVNNHDHHHPQMYRGVAVGAPSSYERGMPSMQSGIRHS